MAHLSPKPSVVYNAPRKEQTIPFPLKPFPAIPIPPFFAHPYGKKEANSGRERIPDKKRDLAEAPYAKTIITLECPSARRQPISNLLASRKKEKTENERGRTGEKDVMHGWLGVCKNIFCPARHSSRDCWRRRTSPLRSDVRPAKAAEDDEAAVLAAALLGLFVVVLAYSRSSLETDVYLHS